MVVTVVVRKPLYGSVCRLTCSDVWCLTLIAGSGEWGLNVHLTGPQEIMCRGAL